MNAPELIKNTTGGSVAKGSRGILVFLGLMLIGFWFIGSLMSIQATEAWILHGPIVHFVPNWNLLLQVPRMFTDPNETPEQAQATMWGWGIEFGSLILIVGYELAVHSVGLANSRLVPWLKTGLVLIFLFDVWTNFQYGQLASGVVGNIAFALFTSFATAFFGVVGAKFLEAGIAK